MSTAIPIPMPAEAPHGRRDLRLWLRPCGLVLLFAVWMIVRWLFSIFRQLVPDEAYYWVWSRHLAMSYVDHPPMIAWLIRLGTQICGTNELGVRFMMTILTAGTILMMTRSARRLITDWRGSVRVDGIALMPADERDRQPGDTGHTGVLFPGGGAGVCLDDSSPPCGRKPRCAMAGVWSVHRFGSAQQIHERSARTFDFLALLWTAEGRRHLRTPWPWWCADRGGDLFARDSLEWPPPLGIVQIPVATSRSEHR